MQPHKLFSKLQKYISNNKSETVIDEITKQLFLEIKLNYFFMFSINKNYINVVYKKSSNQNFNIEEKIRIDGIIFDKLQKEIKKTSINNKKIKFLFDILNMPVYPYNLILPVIKNDDFSGFVMILRGNTKFITKDLSFINNLLPYFYSFFLNEKYNQEKEEIQKQINSFKEISSLLVSDKNLQETLNIIVKIVADVMKYKICSIMLYNKEKEELEIKATQSLSKEYKNKPNVKIGQSISGLAVKEKGPVSVLDVVQNPNYKYPEIAKKEGLVSMLAIPMMIKSKIIGVINVYTNYEHVFSKNEQDILLSIANLAAIAIENAQLQEESLKIKDLLESRKVIERAKGILMKKYKLTEEDAYNLIRKKSMDASKSMKEVANAIILTSEIEKK